MAFAAIAFTLMHYCRFRCRRCHFMPPLPRHAPDFAIDADAAGHAAAMFTPPACQRQPLITPFRHAAIAAGAIF
jgi:hypothetical protein